MIKKLNTELDNEGREFIEKLMKEVDGDCFKVGWHLRNMLLRHTTDMNLDEMRKFQKEIAEGITY